MTPMFEFSCLFHSDCFDCFHIATSILTVISVVIISIGLVSLIAFCINCAKHTAYCNELAHENYRNLLTLSKRIDSLEDPTYK